MTRTATKVLAIAASLMLVLTVLGGGAVAAVPGDSGSAADSGSADTAGEHGEECDVEDEEPDQEGDQEETEEEEETETEDDEANTEDVAEEDECEDEDEDESEGPADGDGFGIMVSQFVHGLLADNPDGGIGDQVSCFVLANNPGNVPDHVLEKKGCNTDDSSDQEQAPSHPVSQGNGQGNNGADTDRDKPDSPGNSDKGEETDQSVESEA